MSFLGFKFSVQKKTFCTLIIASLFCSLSPGQPAPSVSTGTAAATSNTAVAPTVVAAPVNATRAGNSLPSANAPNSAATLQPSDSTKSSSEDARQAKTKDKASQAPSDLPAAEAIKDTNAGETEFQRFVRGATGQSLRLYGYDLFARADSFASVQSAPVPDGYILGPGDELVVQINGLIELNDRLVIDRDGRVLVPKVGPLSLAGVALSDAEKVLSAHISKVYRNFTISVTMGRLRSIEVFVVGQASKPGKHLVSSLSSLINALFQTGGPSPNGSLRGIQLLRGGKLIATVDMYAFLARGDNSGDVKILSGDIIFIPAAMSRAALLGTINAPAIYELRDNETINNILNLSGGMPTLATPQKAQLERVDSLRDIARYVEDFALDKKGLDQVLKAGDILTVFQISPQIANVVTLQGNVAAPLRYSFKKGMRVADILNDTRLLIPGSYWMQINQGATTGNYSRPEVNLDYATIQRLDPLALRTKVVAFNLSKAIAHDKAENLELLSGDIVTVYAPNDPGPETENSISITGDVMGGTKRFVWRAGITIKDIIPSSQWLIDYYSYWQRPVAKSLRNDINWDYAQVIRRVPARLSSQAITFNLGNAVLNGSATDNISLEPGDQIALFTTAQLAVPLEKRTQIVTIAGEVMAPGAYQIQADETLPDLIKRAGGFSRNAFPYGTVFTRESTRVQQQANLEKSARQMEAAINSQAVTNMQNVVDSEKTASLQSQLMGQRIMLSRIQGLKASGRIALEQDPESPQPPQITLEDGDQITIPHRPSFVGVFGEVLAETSFIHKPGNTVNDYLDKAGLTKDADTDSVMLIRADGTVENNARGLALWRSGVMSKKLFPGDSVFVPGVVDRRTFYSQFIQGAKDWTTILYQFGLGAAGLKTIRQ